MHILVTDRLACPRCGPGFGLVLMADDLRDRRVRDGFLGCSNCRERYPVARGFGDLRPAPRSPPDASPVELRDDPEAALRVAAFLGVREGPGLLLLTGGSVALAARVAAIVEGIEVVAAHPGLADAPGAEGVSRVTVGERLPFLTGSLRGIVLEGEEGARHLDEAVRVLVPGARLVVLDPPSELGGRMEEMGLELLLEAEGTLVGARKR